jgi:FkbM family methyltransferase
MLDWLRKPRPPAACTAPATQPWAHPYDPAASEADILSCFRLLLGRNPNPEEWRGHAARAGEPLPSVVASYLNSLEFARRGLLAQDHLGGMEPVELDGFRLYAAPGDAGVGRGVLDKSYEPDVTAVFRRLLRPGMGVLDLGANIGFFTMLSASLVGSAGWVVAVEPNPANVKLLEASRRLNGFAQVTVCQVAAGRKPGLLVLNTSYSNGTTSTLPDDVNALLGAEIVPCVRADSLVPPGRRVDVVKADVEGAEYAALLGCSELIARWRPILIIEFSPNLMPGISGISGPDYARWLMGLGYGLGVVQTDGSIRPAPDADAVMAAFEAKGVDHVDLVATPVEA